MGPSAQPAAPATMVGGGYAAPGGQFGPPSSPFGQYEAPAPQAPPPEQRTFRILCPKGHELQTPEEMLGSKAQ